METSNPNYSNNTTQPLLISTVLSTNVLHAKGPIGLDPSKDKVRRCRKCRKTFKNHGTYLSHVKFHNAKVRKPKTNNALFHQQEFRCKLCEANCTGVSAFLDHIKSHADQHEATYAPLQTQQQVDVAGTTIQIPNISDGNSAPQEVIEEHAMSLGQSGELSGEQISNYITTNLQPNHLQMPANMSQGDSFQSNNNATGMHIEIPSHVRSLSFNSSNTNNSTITQLNTIMKTLSSLHNKIDIVMKHLDITLDEEGNPITTAGDQIEVNQQGHSTQNSGASEQEKPMEGDDGETVLLEGFPPSYSIVQAAKEQQQQEFYALTLSNRQTQQLTQTSNDMKLLKGKGIDLWVPTSHQYILAEAQPDDEPTELTIPIPTTTPTITLPSSIVDKIFVESRSRANFAKNLTFAVFTQEERRGKNCTGRVFGKAQHKGQLDPIKLAAVKEATFRKYPCSPNLVDITWRKECITAIDSGLRNEHRSTAMKTGGGINENNGTSTSTRQQHQLVISNVSSEMKQETINEQQNTLIET